MVSVSGVMLLGKDPASSGVSQWCYVVHSSIGTGPASSTAVEGVAAKSRTTTRALHHRHKELF